MPEKDNKSQAKYKNIRDNFLIFEVIDDTGQKKYYRVSYNEELKLSYLGEPLLDAIEITQEDIKNVETGITSKAKNFIESSSAEGSSIDNKGTEENNTNTDKTDFKIHLEKFLIILKIQELERQNKESEANNKKSNLKGIKKSLFSFSGLRKKPNKTSPNQEEVINIESLKSLLRDIDYQLSSTKESENLEAFLEDKNYKQLETVEDSKPLQDIFHLGHNINFIEQEYKDIDLSNSQILNIYGEASSINAEHISAKNIRDSYIYDSDNYAPSNDDSKQPDPNLLTLYGNIKCIAPHSFRMSKITHLKQDSVIAVLESAFKESQLQKYENSQKLIFIGSEAFSNTKINEMILESAQYIDDNALSGCTKLKSMDLPKIRHLGKKAFYGCKQLKTVQLSDHLQNILEETFADCPIESLRLGESIDSIEHNAFKEHYAFNKGKYFHPSHPIQGRSIRQIHLTDPTMINKKIFKHQVPKYVDGDFHEMEKAGDKLTPLEWALKNDNIVLACDLITRYGENIDFNNLDSRYLSIPMIKLAAHENTVPDKIKSAFLKEQDMRYRGYPINRFTERLSFQEPARLEDFDFIKQLHQNIEIENANIFNQKQLLKSLIVNGQYLETLCTDENIEKLSDIIVIINDPNFFQDLIKGVFCRHNFYDETDNEYGKSLEKHSVLMEKFKKQLQKMIDSPFTKMKEDLLLKEKIAAINTDRNPALIGKLSKKLSKLQAQKINKFLTDKDRAELLHSDLREIYQERVKDEYLDNIKKIMAMCDENSNLQRSSSAVPRRGL